MKRIDCDSEFQKDLDRINADIKLEDELAEASETMEIQELLENARIRGSEYGTGYENGFWAGYNLCAKSSSARMESVRVKHEKLRRRWGLP